VRVILIAAKELAFAKTRLGAALGAGERIELARAMFRDVLNAAACARAADHVAVISSDRSLLELANQAGAIIIDEEFPRGLNAAVGLATGALVAEGARTVCTLLSDIPLVTADDIDEVFAAHQRLAAGAGGLGAESVAVILVPSRDLTGTNMMVRAPGDVIPTRFGSHSLARHLHECRTRNLACEVIRMPRPSVDLDVLEDLIEFVRVPTNTHTFGQLARLGLVQG
jgi:2-phospho-L-lactate guanylyltransferase